MTHISTVCDLFILEANCNKPPSQITWHWISGVIEVLSVDMLYLPCGHGWWFGEKLLNPPYSNSNYLQGGSDLCQLWCSQVACTRWCVLTSFVGAEVCLLACYARMHRITQFSCIKSPLIRNAITLCHCLGARLQMSWMKTSNRNAYDNIFLFRQRKLQ